MSSNLIDKYRDFYELLYKVPLYDLIPMLNLLDAGEIYPYREALDELMLIGTVEEDDGVIEVSRCQRSWREVLAGRIEVEGGLNLTDCELATHILREKD